MAKPSLQTKMSDSGDVVGMLRNSKIGMYVYPVVASEFTNWRDEQRAWRETAVLFDQSHHMDELIVDGPDAARASGAADDQQLQEFRHRAGPSISCRSPPTAMSSAT